jgi:NAD(P)-dependent dehydrogenase (short-subunit alcohol dehydrogenase family)
VTDPSLGGNVAIITGGGSGVGAAVAKALADLGVHTVLTGRREARLHEVTESLATPGIHIAADITDPATPDRVVATAVERFGRLDIVVHAAGIFEKRPLSATDAEFWHRIIDVNLTAVVALTRSAWSPLCTNAGQVVLVSSAAAEKGFPDNSAYAASKGGMNAFGEVLRVEGRPHGVRVITLSPAQIDTELWDGKAPDHVRAEMMRPGGVGRLIASLVSADRSIDFAPITIQPPSDPWSKDTDDPGVAQAGES